MVESYSPKYGFVVSRKKYLQMIRPMMMRPFIENTKNAPETVYTGHVTGTTLYGVYVELNECITGMVHKTLASDELREAMRNNTINPDTEISVYVHKIEGNRLILSDVAPSEREAVIARREAEDEAEKNNHLAQKAAQQAEKQ
jgi:ribosomal protein S1